MAQSKVSCNKIGCECSKYSGSTSKWSKGKCETCNHSRLEHEGNLITSEPQQITSKYNKDNILNKNNKKNIAEVGNDSPSPPPPNDNILEYSSSSHPIKPPQQYHTTTNAQFKHINTNTKTKHVNKLNKYKNETYPKRKTNNTTHKLNKLEEKTEQIVNINDFKSKQSRNRRGALDNSTKTKKHVRSVTVPVKHQSIKSTKKHNKTSNSNTLNTMKLKLKLVSKNLKSNKKAKTPKPILTKNNKLTMEFKKQEFDEKSFEKHDSLIKQTAFQQVELLKLQKQKWKLKYKNQGKKLQKLRKEKLNIEKKTHELNDSIQRMQDQIELYRKNALTEDMMHVNSRDEECHDSLVTGDDYMDCKLSDNEVCLLLQQDLENYMCDQKKNMKAQWRREQKYEMKNKAPKKERFVLKELRLWADNKAEIMRDWIALKKNYFQGLFEKYEEILEERYDDDEEE
eukprot:92523_1